MLETGFYAGLLALVYLFLSVRIIRMRLRTKTSLGDGGHAELTSAIRAHGNFAEYVPFIMLMIGILNFQGLSLYIIHALGMTLLIGRCIHAYSISKNILKLRPIGMALTFLTLGVTASLLVIHYFIMLQAAST